MLAKCKCVYITEVTADSFRLILLLFQVIVVAGHKLSAAGIVTKRQSSVVVIQYKWANDRDRPFELLCTFA